MEFEAVKKIKDQGKMHLIFFNKFKFFSGRGGIRTRDIWLRRPAPYPG
jgi:hypothetical protein